MATRIQVRQGNLSELPILAPGEQGYALDANRLFIGNSPIDILGTGSNSYSFGVDLDLVYPSAFEFSCDQQLEYTDSILGLQSIDIVATTKNINNDVVTFVVADSDPLVTTPVAANVPVGATVTLRHNTELLTYVPDREDDPSRSETLVGSNGAGDTSDVAVIPKNISSLSLDQNRYDSAEIKYIIRDEINNEHRTGTITLSLMDSTFNIQDSYITTNDTLLPHEFDGSFAGNTFTVNYKTTNTDDVVFSYITNFWKS